MATKRVIVLDRPDRTDPNTYRIALWAAVPAARQVFYAVAGAKSAWKDASAPENADIAAGVITERVESIQFPPGASSAQIQTHLENRWTNFQADITNVNPWSRYGTVWDGTWTPGGVA